MGIGSKGAPASLCDRSHGAEGCWKAKARMAVQDEGWGQERGDGRAGGGEAGRREGAQGVVVEVVVVVVIIIKGRRSKVGSSRCCRDPM